MDERHVVNGVLCNRGDQGSFFAWTTDSLLSSHVRHKVIAGIAYGDDLES